MATNFGFMPVQTGKRYFISYKNEDTARVGEITRRLNQMGVPMWYDYGIEKGERWSDEINRNIEECEAFILFATRKLFAAEDTWVRKEFRLASMSQKKKYVVWLDDLNPYENPNDVHSKLKSWFVDVDDLQGIRMAGKTVEHIAWSMVTEFHLIQGKKPQPPSPTFQPPVTQPVNQPNPATYTAPIPQQPATATKPAPVPIFRDSTPKQEQMKPVIQKLVKHTPLIVTVAVVLVIAMVSSIWAVSHSNSNPASDLTSSSSSDSTDDSTESVKSLSELGSVSVGDHFTFGKYPQGANGEEQPIEWRVLAVEDGKALVISEKLLYCVEYNETRTDVTWETCKLRKWMNNDFISKAFSSSQQAKISTVTIQNPDNPLYGTEGGYATHDRIFALSIDEAEKYFSFDTDREAFTTDYAHKKGYDVRWWWLRSPGERGSSAAFVDGYGDITQSGSSVRDNRVAVRPAFWLNLSSDSTDDSTESESLEKIGSQIDISDLSGLNAVYNGKYYTFTFGNYPQGEDGEEQPIEWRVLAVENGRALVISEKLLDCVQYNETRTDVTWETCTLRKWLNNDFISKAFSSSQQAKIITVTNQNPDNPSRGTKGGNATQDRIFALSIDEAEKYFGSKDDRMAAPTEYAKKQGCSVSDGHLLPNGEKTGDWWLRSPGGISYDAAYVLSFGGIQQYGNVEGNYWCVRPAFWLNL